MKPQYFLLAISTAILFPGTAPSAMAQSPNAMNLTADDLSWHVKVVQHDGKKIITGKFSSVLGVPRSKIARLNADGSLDMAFDPKADGDVSSAAVQADGKILIGGSFGSLQPNGAATPTSRNFLARLHPDGSLDTDFDLKIVNQPIAEDDRVSEVAVQPDGKILVAGYIPSFQPKGASSVQKSGASMLRLHPDGSIDATFNAPRPDLYLSCFALQTDGKIVVGGSFSSLTPNGNSAAVKRGSIARLNGDGSIDSDFDPNPQGYTMPNLDPQGWARVRAITIQTNGQILVGGDFLTFQANDAATPTDRKFIARLNSDGNLDAGFNPKADHPISNIQVQADGKILLYWRVRNLPPNGTLAYVIASSTSIARLNADGSVDASFDPNTGNDSK